MTIVTKFAALTLVMGVGVFETDARQSCI